MHYLKISLIILFFLLSGCESGSVNGYLAVSSSIRESKERNVFIQEYTVPQNPFIINDSIHIHVKYAWLEHTWRYKGLQGDSTKIEKNGYQLIIRSDTSSLSNYTESWLIGTRTDSNFRFSSIDGIMTDLKGIPEHDTLSWDVQQGRDLSYLSKDEKTMLGHFILIAVK
jgi:hypothetical protein